MTNPWVKTCDQLPEVDEVVLGYWESIEIWRQCGFTRQGCWVSLGVIKNAPDYWMVIPPLPKPEGEYSAKSHSIFHKEEGPVAKCYSNEMAKKLAKLLNRSIALEASE